MCRSLLLFIALSLVVSACGTLEISLATPPPEITDIPVGFILEVTPTPRLSLNSSSEEIRKAILESAREWETIWMDGVVTWYAPAGLEAPPQVFREQVWIDRVTPRFRTLLGPGEGEAEQFVASDGISILKIDLKSGRSELSSLPAFVTEDSGDSAQQALWGQIGTPLSEIALASSYAVPLEAGIYRPVGMEIVAGREALIVEVTRPDAELPQWRMSLDILTGVILKLAEFGEGGEAELRGERLVNQVVYDDPFADNLFRAPSTLPQFGDVTGMPLAASESVPTASPGSDPLHEIYFFVADNNTGNERIQLMWVPGSCAAGLAPCPNAEAISTPFQLKFGLTSLVWSPDGQAAAFAYPINASGDRSALFLFEPQSQTWRSLAEFNFIDPPFWSPDGAWLAFRVQDGNGRDEIYAIGRDGSGLTNLSASEKLPAEGHPYTLSGWINRRVLLHGRGNGILYLLRPEDGSATPLFDVPATKSHLVVPSPDGYFLAYTEVSEQKTTLKLLTPDGRTVRELAAFPGASIYPIVWSPDGTSLAFAKMTSDPAGGQDIYVIGQDGRNLRQVYHSSWGSINELSFSPDGSHLLFRDDDATGRHIFVVDLSTLAQRLLQTPNLPLDWAWLAPSWR
jgi:hypothetical protein